MIVNTATGETLQSARKKALAEIIAYALMFAIAMFVSETVAYWGVLVALTMSIERYRESFRP